jgi:CRISPR-associated protein Csm1
MQERESFYLGALLHDIGKFIQRANIPEWQDLAGSYVKSGEASRNHAHRRYSAAVIKQLLRKFLSGSDVEMYALLHHQGRERGKADHQRIGKNGIPLKLIHIADICASKERKQVPELEPQHYTRAKLQSIFSDITLTDKDGNKLESAQKKYLDLNPLSLARESLFPAKGIEPAFENQV